ncbi:MULTISPECIES: MATE family efflux transporter [unclassified Bacteroides]|jgi:MATE family multidrug resistance protein|uniref:MATE family efflux transporter n=1 Tax=unclassified Bacteroides TaxID=2646097 RepID=UPI000E8E1325|nr:MULTISPECIES: MATE family efflux transporter [unclassified Bacteroides]RGN49128.1 MATE family efflux transporter [Bacteroides sp. OM05-12]RHR83238.1 MATE family efflux transporter [Bacteroides sp. AF16-49]
MNTPTKYSYKEIWLITYPILVSLIMEQLIGMTDTAFLGRVGEIELGASALAGVYYMIIFMIAFGFSIGAQILIGRRNGEGNYKQIGSIFYQGVVFLLSLAVVMFVLSQLYSPYILKDIIQSNEVFHATVSYINWRVYGFFFSFIGVMFRAFFVGTTQTKTLTLNSIVMVLSNVIFNYILIFGKFGFPALGIAGAAIGSSLAELVSVIFFIIYTCRKIDFRKYGLNHFSGIQWGILKRILNVSLWTMIQNFLSMSTWFLFFIAVEHLGERSLAITNIIRNVSAIPFMTVIAFASTTSTLISNLIGAGDIQYVRGTLKQTIRMAYYFVAPIIIIFAVFPSLILHIYTNSQELVYASTPALWVLCSAYLFLVPGNIYFQAVSGTGNTRSALMLEFTTLIIYVLYVCYMIFYLRIDVAWCWTTEHVYGGFIYLFSWWYMKKGKWQNKRI